MSSPLGNLVRMVLVYASPRYAERTARCWWESSKAVTHADQSDSAYDFYTDRILEVTGARTGQLICDFGCGDGSIAERLRARGMTVRCVDGSAALRDAARRRGLDCVSPEEFFAGADACDIIFMNEVYFYVHPRQRRAMLQRLRGKLRSGGRLCILDEPDLAKAGRLGAGRLRELIWGVLPVYDVPSAGFFNNVPVTVRTALASGFRSAEVLDSWSDYRSHIVLGA